MVPPTSSFFVTPASGGPGAMAQCLAAPCSCQGQTCMGQLLSSLMVGEVNGTLGWVRAGLTIRGERAIGLQPNTLVFGRPRVGLDHDAAMRIGGEAPGGGPIL